MIRRVIDSVGDLAVEPVALAVVLAGWDEVLVLVVLESDLGPEAATVLALALALALAVAVAVVLVMEQAMEWFRYLSQMIHRARLR